MTYRAGIDLGTTFTAAAVLRDGEGRPEIVTLTTRSASVPSVVFVGVDDSILIGDVAERRAGSEPDRVAREFKRRLGDPTPLLLGGAPYSPEALSAKVLRSVVDSIEELEGGPAETIVVTHPANWGPYKKELLTQILRIAGLEDARTTSEPEAAAAHYASNERVEPGTVVAVYDFGGGTFDAAVLRKTDAGFEILGEPEGLEHLGGIDFDHAILAHVDQALSGALGTLDLSSTEARADVVRLRGECAAAKEALSTDTDATISVTLPGVRTEIRLTRSEFEDMIRPSISETIESLRRAVRSSGVEADAVDRVLLVGGSSRIPLVSRMLAAEFGRPVSLDAHPKHAIALGAAQIASPAADVVAALPPEPVEAEPGAEDGLPALLPPPTPTARGLKRPRRKVPLTPRATVATAVVLTLVGSGLAYSMFLRPTAEAAEVLYQDPVAEGPSPFTEPAVNKTPDVSKDDGEAGVGEAQGPFGGSGQLTQCKKEALVRFLNDNPERKKAWTGVLGVPVDGFEEYVDGLKKASIHVDTRVTNHGFRGGKAFELQSILAKGTAVLVDKNGQIVVRCYCGNPLRPAKALGATSCRGCPRNYSPPRACSGAGCYSVTKTSSSSGETSNGASTLSSSNRGASTSQANAATPRPNAAVSVRTTAPVKKGSTSIGNQNTITSTPKPEAPPPGPTPAPPTATPCDASQSQPQSRVHAADLQPCD